MKFKLFEDYPFVSEEEKESWDDASPTLRSNIVSNIIEAFNNPQAKKLKNTINKAAYEWGISSEKDAKTNPFFIFLDDFMSSIKNINTTHDKYLCTFIDMINSGEIRNYENILSDRDPGEIHYMFEPSMYDRTLQEFIYSVRVFELLRDSSRLSKYYKNTDDISYEDLFENDKIKPAGGPNNPDDLSTIYGTVESWSESGENDKSPQSAKKSDKITASQLKQARTKYHFDSLDKVDPELKRDGQIVHVTFEDLSKLSADIPELIDGYYIFKDGLWDKIDK